MNIAQVLDAAPPTPANSRNNLTHERLKELFFYNPESGLFSRRTARGNCKLGKPPGWINLRGYLVMSIDKHDYLAHRLTWLYMTGAWPNGDIDHMNGDIACNRWSNLRDVTKSTNTQNQRKAHSNNKSMVLGVHARNNGSFDAVIKINGKRRYLGYFKCPKKAHEAYLIAKRENHEGCTI